MTGTGSIARAIAALENGESPTEALAILRIFQSTHPIPGLTVPQYAAELEPLTHPILAMTAACALVQYRLALEKLAHVRRELKQMQSFEPVRAAPSTWPAPPDESPESGDG
jgi:hypothetical protein